MKNYNELAEICKKHGAVYEKDAPLAPYTTFKIGGVCDFLVKVNSENLIQEIVRSGTKYHVLGNGSNVLVSDEGVRGVVLLFGSDYAEVSVCGEFMNCQAGAKLSDICKAAQKEGLTGLEFAYGIPATVGGAVYMNAGAYDGEISQTLSEADYLDEDGEFKTLICDKTQFAYRKSPFTGKKSVILKAVFLLEFGDKAQITAKMEDFMRRRKDKQPLDFPSAGSTFKRPEGDYASRLIDVCGLKGFSVGGAEVSGKHAGFIINKGGATCGDVLRLIEAVKERVFKETGIMLEQEVKLI
jgi:UDP-N-acetylmuramate dehydrogenase